MIAVAAWTVAGKLSIAEREQFLKAIYPNLLAYHRWIYNDRDPNSSGLAVLVHPWESGMDNSPPWIYALRWLSPLWISVLVRSRLINFFQRFRKDTKSVPAGQRLTNTEALKFLHLAYRYRKHNYDSRWILENSRFCVEDLAFNSILVAANTALRKIADTIAEDLPAELSYRFDQTAQALEKLWDEETAQYYSRQYKSQKLIAVPSITTLLPLYSGAISKQRAGRLVDLLHDRFRFWSEYPVPTVPLNSKYFRPDRYWKGPTWINMNWFIIKGLLNYGYREEALSLLQRTRELIRRSGFREYFSPLTGDGLGIDNFSWTAALYIDLEHLEIS